ncbi:peripherin isoform X1 [Synchiropus splendidus]|uniref:peripherin isoform X1 n=1 Tax=Synchiropus splendidus TaxID=270530 RepID=UPI00237E4263|nr:peripherin isoform X1 [Synchiropus splendidus]
MAMLRLSSYRRLFEEQNWSRNGSFRMSGAVPYSTTVRSRAGAVDDCDCDKLDFESAKVLNKEGLSQFVQDRTVIAALNDRLVRLIELARCIEEENEALECQIDDLKGRVECQKVSGVVAASGYSLDAVVERLRRDRDEILCVTEKSLKQLGDLKVEHEKAVQKRMIVQLQHQDIAEEVDVVTAECLALREQAHIYEQQLANMEAQHKMEVENLLTDGAATAMRAMKFSSPDLSSALDVKAHYCQLVDELQCECGSSFTTLAATGDGTQASVGEAVRWTGKDMSKREDDAEIKLLMAERQKELAELEKCSEELEDEIEMRKGTYAEEIAELECRVAEMKRQETELDVQMKEQCEDYDELMMEKMARDMEIAAYRSLVEEEERRLHDL